MKGRNIVVTGGAGFIGSNIARALSRKNNVIVIDDLSTGNFENIQDLINSQNITFVKGSVTDLKILQKTFRDMDYVFHQAAIPSVPRSVKDPIRSNNTNINGTLNVLVAAKNNGLEKVIYASSSSVYGDTTTLPKNENMNPCPLSPYAVSKLTGEYYCKVFTKIYDLPTISLRYFNVYGPWQDPVSEYAAVIPKFITWILTDKSPIIYGDGKQTRDFTFIKDVVNANILAAENRAQGVYNIAAGKRVMINDLAYSIMNISGKNLNIIYDTPRPGDIMHSFADISRAKEKLNYEPKFKLTKGLQETVEWLRIRI